MTKPLENNDATFPPPRPAAPFEGAENPANSGFSENDLGSIQQNEAGNRQDDTWKTRGVCSADVLTPGIVDLAAVAATLLTQHKAKQRSGQQLTVAQGFWATRLRLCLAQIKNDETPERADDLEQAVRVYRRACEAAAAGPAAASQ